MRLLLILMILICLAGAGRTSAGSLQAYLKVCTNGAKDTFYIDTNSIREKDSCLQWVYRIQHWPRLENGIMRCDSSLNCVITVDTGWVSFRPLPETCHEEMYWRVRRHLKRR